jgi:hypothetical protein
MSRCRFFLDCGASSLWFGLVTLLLAVTGCQETTSDTLSQTATNPAIEDVEATLRGVLSETVPFERFAGVSRLFERVNQDELEVTRAVFESPTLAPSAADTAVFAAWWSRFDAPAAFEWTSQNAKSGVTFAVVFEQWGRDDPAGAALLLGAGGSVDAAFLQDANVALLRGWLESGKPGMRSYLGSLSGSKSGVKVLESFGRIVVARRGPRGTIEFLDTMSGNEPQLMGKLLFAFARPITRASPEVGVDLFERYHGRQMGVNLLISIGEGWVDARGGESAMSWVWEQKDHPRLKAALGSVYRRWIVQDKEAAMTWMEERTDFIPPELEPALITYLGLKSQDDILRALELRKWIRQGLVRRDVTLKLLRDWRRRDPVAANEWIDSATTLSDYVREQLAEEKDKVQLRLQGKRPG